MGVAATRPTSASGVERPVVARSRGPGRGSVCAGLFSRVGGGEPSWTAAQVGPEVVVRPGVLIGGSGVPAENVALCLIESVAVSNDGRLGSVSA